MIRIYRESLSASLTDELGKLTGKIQDVQLSERSVTARKLWRTHDGSSKYPYAPCFYAAPDGRWS